MPDLRFQWKSNLKNDKSKHFRFWQVVKFIYVTEYKASSSEHKIMTRLGLYFLYFSFQFYVSLIQKTESCRHSISC